MNKANYEKARGRALLEMLEDRAGNKSPAARQASGDHGPLAED